MPSGVQAAVYAAIYDRLVATPALTALLAAGSDSITTHAVLDMALPYVFIADGAVDVLATGSACARIGIDIEIYSAQRGGNEAREVAHAVQAALAQELTVLGYRCVLQDVAGMGSQPMRDGQTHRATLSLQLICEAVEV